MNSKQMKVLWVAVSLAILFGLFPPWAYQFDVTNNGFRLVQQGASSRYPFHFILDAPSPQFLTKDDVKLGGIVKDADLNNNGLNIKLALNSGSAYSIDISRLLVIWFLIAVVSSAFIYTFRDIGPSAKPQQAPKE